MIERSTSLIIYSTFFILAIVGFVRGTIWQMEDYPLKHAIPLNEIFTDHYKLLIVTALTVIAISVVFQIKYFTHLPLFFSDRAVRKMHDKKLSMDNLSFHKGTQEGSNFISFDSAEERFKALHDKDVVKRCKKDIRHIQIVETEEEKSYLVHARNHQVLAKMDVPTEILYVSKSDLQKAMEELQVTDKDILLNDRRDFRVLFKETPLLAAFRGTDYGMIFGFTVFMLSVFIGAGVALIRFAQFFT